MFELSGNGLGRASLLQPTARFVGGLREAKAKALAYLDAKTHSARRRCGAEDQVGARLGVVLFVIEESLRPFIVAEDCVVFDLTIFEPDKQRNHRDRC